MFFECYALAGLALALAAMPADLHVGDGALTTLHVDRVPGGLNLSWNDTEDLVRGMVTPAPLRDGTPLTVSVNVATYQGAPFDGPVTFSLRPLMALGGADIQTVTRRPGEKLWVATLTPYQGGPHRLEVSFRTTHFKVVSTQLELAEAPLPPWLHFAVGAGLIVMAVGFGAWLVLRRGMTQ